MISLGTFEDDAILESLYQYVLLCYQLLTSHAKGPHVTLKAM